MRRWPCWPGPYSRLLTGDFGRPQMFSPRRRSILYFADSRLLIAFPFKMMHPEPRVPGEGNAPSSGLRFRGPDRVLHARFAEGPTGHVINARLREKRYPDRSLAPRQQKIAPDIPARRWRLEDRTGDAVKRDWPMRRGAFEPFTATTSCSGKPLRLVSKRTPRAAFRSSNRTFPWRRPSTSLFLVSPRLTERAAPPLSVGLSMSLALARSLSCCRKRRRAKPVPGLQRIELVYIAIAQLWNNSKAGV